MGKQSRLRAERRQGRALQGRATDVLRELYDKIRCLTLESPRRCWEWMLEIVANQTGINCLDGGCLTHASSQVLGDIPNIDSIIREYAETWDDELQACKLHGVPVTDPLGTILEEHSATNTTLDQFFTPLPVVRMMNAVTMGDGGSSQLRTALDPCCGTGRMALDAVVHYPNIVTFNVDVDLWMVRAAIVNFHTAVRFSHVVIENHLKPSASEGLFSDNALGWMRKSGNVAQTPDSKRLIVIGGRTWTIWADALLVDLMEYENWSHAWKWDPPPWQSTMKLAGYNGTFEDWTKAGRPRRQLDERTSPPPSHSAGLVGVDFDLEEAHLHAQMLRAAKPVELPIAKADERGEAEPLFASPRRVTALDDAAFSPALLNPKRSR
jgi:hypothetical protein